MFKQFTDNLKKAFIRLFGVLDSGYVADVLDDGMLDLETELVHFYDVRYGLFRPDLVELKTTVLFQTEREAGEIARLSNARIGIVLIPKQ